MNTKKLVGLINLITIATVFLAVVLLSIWSATTIQNLGLIPGRPAMIFIALAWLVAAGVGCKWRLSLFFISSLGLFCSMMCIAAPTQPEFWWFGVLLAVIALGIIIVWCRELWRTIS